MTILFKHEMFPVQIEDSAVSEIIRTVDEYDPKQVATCLYGYYSDDATTAVVTGVVPVPEDSEMSEEECSRGVVGLAEFFKNLWDQTDRRYYLGDVHSRPGRHTSSSSLDDETMRGIVDETIPEALLLIVGGTRGNRTCRAILYYEDGLKADLGEQPL